MSGEIGKALLDYKLSVFIKIKTYKKLLCYYWGCGKVQCSWKQELLAKTRTTKENSTTHTIRILLDVRRCGIDRVPTQYHCSASILKAAIKYKLAGSRGEEEEEGTNKVGVGGELYPCAGPRLPGFCRTSSLVSQSSRLGRLDSPILSALSWSWYIPRWLNMIHPPDPYLYPRKSRDTVLRGFM
ncbi:hypothetical protein J6590_026959 [Homalodisca vitripennis]|nr:hypothetical protein J6590_026959 [Homalodisca vitripennis]